MGGHHDAHSIAASGAVRNRAAAAPPWRGRIHRGRHPHRCGGHRPGAGVGGGHLRGDNNTATATADHGAAFAQSGTGDNNTSTAVASDGGLAEATAVLGDGNAADATAKGPNTDTQALAVGGSSTATASAEGKAKHG